jgi:FkbM family methyltransferase
MGLKETVKSCMPDSAWQWTKKVFRKSWLFAPFMALFYKEFKTCGLTFVFPKEFLPIPAEGYESGEIEAVNKFIKPGDRVLELGGCLGVVSCVTNARLQEKSRHVVVEANPFLLPYLYANRERNGGGFLIVHGIVSPEAVSRLNFQGNIHSSSSKGAASDSAILLPGVTATEISRRFGPFDVLIMDIEGSEAEVILQERETIKAFRLLIIEFHPGIIGVAACEKIKGVLREIGFSNTTQSENVEVWAHD